MMQSFATRLYHIPLVSTAVDQVGSFYSRNKERHPVISVACRVAEISFKVAIVSAQPILDRLEQPIDRLDQIACYQLDRLQASYPIINTPTELLISRVKKSVSDVFTSFTLHSFPQSGGLSDVELDVQKSDAGASTRSAILTWRLSPSSISAWLLPNPFVLFSVADKMAVAVEHCFGNLVNDEESNKGYPLVVMDVACTFYSQTLKRLRCQVALVDKFIHVHDMLPCLGRAVSYQCLQGLFIVLLDWFVSHSPLLFLIPDFSSTALQESDAYEADDGNMDHEGVIGFVPLNPADLAALPVIRPQRMYWKRGH